LAQHADGLLVLSGCLNSEVSRALSAGDVAKARQTAGWYQDGFVRDHYYTEVQAHGIPEQVGVTAETLQIARAIGAPVVGTNDSHYLEAGHGRAHEALLCIQTGSTLADPGRWKFSTEEFYIKSAEEMALVFADIPEACRNTLAVAERCNLTLDFGRFHLPKYVVPEGHTLETYLQHLAREGLRRRYGPSPGEAIEARLGHELAVIEKMGFAGYFLVVWDFIHYAREHGIAVGPGRGSSAGSLVAYCLGITNIDPMRYGLLFERFLNPERVSMPDMDIDFAGDRGDAVIRYGAALGVVSPDGPRDEHVLIHKDPKRPELITGYAMGPIEKLGLLKMDFLGLRTLTVLANTAKLIKESRGIAIDFDALPLDDAKA